MVSRPLIPEKVLKQLQDVADRSKRSVCSIGHTPRIDNGKGGTKAGTQEWRGPYPCRLDPSGVQQREGLRGERITPTGDAGIALMLDVVPPEADDVIRVTTTLPNGQDTTETFDVVGDPFFPSSYAVELTIPVRKVGT